VKLDELNPLHLHMVPRLGEFLSEDAKSLKPDTFYNLYNQRLHVKNKAIPSYVEKPRRAPNDRLP